MNRNFAVSAAAAAASSYFFTMSRARHTGHARSNRHSCATHARPLYSLVNCERPFIHGLSRSKDLGHKVRKRTIFFVIPYRFVTNLFCRKSIFLPYLSYELDKKSLKRCIERRAFHRDDSNCNRKPM